MNRCLAGQSLIANSWARDLADRGGPPQTHDQTTSAATSH